MRDLFLLGLCACGPRWIDAREEHAALAEAIATAKQDHQCENVVPRCDASHDMTWEFELDVCGVIERYTVTDDSVGQVPVECHDKICLGPTPPCRSAMRGTWWAVEAHAPERCDDAPIDDALHVDQDGWFVRVAAAGRYDVSASCTDPSFMVAIDGRWFALCGSIPRQQVDDLVIEPGLMTGTGPHDAYAVHLQPGGCSRSRADAIVNRVPLSWVDI